MGKFLFLMTFGFFGLGCFLHSVDDSNFSEVSISFRDDFICSTNFDSRKNEYRVEVNRYKTRDVPVWFATDPTLVTEKLGQLTGLGCRVVMDKDKDKMVLEIPIQPDGTSMMLNKDNYENKLSFIFFNGSALNRLKILSPKNSDRISEFSGGKSCQMGFNMETDFLFGCAPTGEKKWEVILPFVEDRDKVFKKYSEMATRCSFLNKVEIEAINKPYPQTKIVFLFSKRVKNIVASKEEVSEGWRLLLDIYTDDFVKFTRGNSSTVHSIAMNEQAFHLLWTT